MSVLFQIFSASLFCSLHFHSVLKNSQTLSFHVICSFPFSIFYFLLLCQFSYMDGGLFHHVPYMGDD